MAEKQQGILSRPVRENTNHTKSQAFLSSCLNNGGMGAGFVSLSSGLYFSLQELKLVNLIIGKKGELQLQT